MENERITRYDIETLPISEATRKGLTAENINYIGAIGRMLSLQDNVYEEQFERMLSLISAQSTLIHIINNNIVDLTAEIREMKNELRCHEKSLRNHETRIKKLERQVNKLIA